MPPSRLFLLSPARCDGERAKLLLNPKAAFPLAVQLRAGDGAELGEVFSFLSGLYFRGKLAYARTFARRPRGVPGSLVITTDRGLVPPETRITADDIAAFARVDIASGAEAYLGPLRCNVADVGQRLPGSTHVVLLGSIATGKYVDTLMATFGDRLVFPSSFVGRGDMSRGGLLLRAVRSGEELEYMPVAGAVRHGTRPPKLVPIRGILSGEVRP